MTYVYTVHCVGGGEHAGVYTAGEGSGAVAADGVFGSEVLVPLCLARQK